MSRDSVVYRIECSVCAFEAEADELGEVLDLQERHREAAGEEHLFEFEKRE